MAIGTQKYITTTYDFKPRNLELLVLSRLDFLSKQQKIYNCVKMKAKEKKDDHQII